MKGVQGGFMLNDFSQQDFSQQNAVQPEPRSYYESVTENKVHTAITLTAGGVLGHYVVAPAIGWVYKKIKLMFTDDKK
jgi:hypothetical protein